MISFPGRNEPCWCGTNKKFKHCHENRHLDKPIPLGQLFQHSKEIWGKERCMHPQSSTVDCGKIIAAHTLSRRSLLSRIIDDKNHVLTFKNPDPLSDQSGPVRVGWKQASTFPGFCSVHDQVFAPIDSGEFTATTEQCFLHSYRGICHELFQKLAAREDYISMRSTLDRGRSHEDQRDIQSKLSASLMGTEKGIQELGELKAKFDHSYLSSDYSGWSKSVFFFKGNLSVASVGSFSPNRSLNGEELQVMHDRNTPQQPLLLSVTATEKGCAVVIFWRTCDVIVTKFVQEIINQEPPHISGVLIQLMFAYLSNTYFSTAWWKWISQASKNHVANLAHISNAYYEQFAYTRYKFADWELTDITY